MFDSYMTIALNFQEKLVSQSINVACLSYIDVTNVITSKLIILLTEYSFLL